MTIYLEESFKNQSDRMWNNLMALDVAILEEHQKAGVIIAETLNKDPALLEKVPGVTAVRIEENEEAIVEPEPKETARIFTLKPKGVIKPVNGERGDKRGRQIAR